MRRFTIAAAVLAVTAVAGIGVGIAIRGGHTGQALAAPRASKAEHVSAGHTQAADGAPVEGIKVHGAWTIQVRNADGSVASTNRFENSLTTTGAGHLADFLARDQSVGRWTIDLVGSSTSPCPYTPTIGLPTGDCLITESDALVARPEFKNLTVASNQGKLVLQGTANASANGQLVAVWTGIGTCGPAQTPASCTIAFPIGFTTKTLNAPVPVSAGQQVQVTVEISFS